MRLIEPTYKGEYDEREKEIKRENATRQLPTSHSLLTVLFPLSLSLPMPLFVDLRYKIDRCLCICSLPLLLLFNSRCAVLGSVPRTQDVSPFLKFFSFTTPLSLFSPWYRCGKPLMCLFACVHVSMRIGFKGSCKLQKQKTHGWWA